MENVTWKGLHKRTQDGQEEAVWQVPEGTGVSQGGGGAEWARYPSLGGGNNPFSLEKSKNVLGIGPHTDDKGK